MILVLKSHLRVLRQSISDFESRTKTKLKSDWGVGSSIRTVGNGRRAVRRVQADLCALRRVSSDLPVVHRTVHMLCRACGRGTSTTAAGDARSRSPSSAVRRAGRPMHRAVHALCGRPNAVAQDRVDRSEWHGRSLVAKNGRHLSLLERGCRELGAFG